MQRTRRRATFLYSAVCLEEQRRGKHTRREKIEGSLRRYKRELSNCQPLAWNWMRQRDLFIDIAQHTRRQKQHNCSCFSLSLVVVYGRDTLRRTHIQTLWQICHIILEALGSKQFILLIISVAVDICPEGK
jgi:hypothetical protein